jgi:hypothetical protein
MKMTGEWGYEMVMGRDPTHLTIYIWMVYCPVIFFWVILTDERDFVSFLCTREERRRISADITALA